MLVNSILIPYVSLPYYCSDTQYIHPLPVHSGVGNTSPSPTPTPTPALPIHVQLESTSPPPPDHPSAPSSPNPAMDLQSGQVETVKPCSSKFIISSQGILLEMNKTSDLYKTQVDMYREKTFSNQREGFSFEDWGFLIHIILAELSFEFHKRSG